MPRQGPVLLTVEDDPAVSRAIARDLRRRYGSDHRVVRSETGTGALEVLRELTLRGEATALILSDYRMPGMNGIDFLEQAMDVVPQAKRVLLTAYADTQAAIRAVNDIDLDHYLVKPWDPPEEHLYPVLDELLENWARDSRPGFEGVTLLGHQWSAETQDLKEFLTSNQVPYRHLRGPEGTALQETAAIPDESLPAVIMSDGVVLTCPPLREVAERLGLATTAGSPLYDLVVIGSGPAGLGAAVYGASEGLRTLLVDRAGVGGQAARSSLIENYLGFPQGVSGAELAQRARDQAVRFDVEMLTAAAAVDVVAQGEGRVVRFDDGHEVTAHAVVIATGVWWSQLPATGADDYAGRGIYYGASAHEAAGCKGEDVFIVGAANSAGQAALHFAQYANRVVMLVRGPELRLRMSEYLVGRIEADPRIEVRTCTQVTAAEGDGRLERIVVTDTRDAGTQTLPATRLFVFIGAEPPTSWLGEEFARNERGFILTGPALLDDDGRPPREWPLTRNPYHLESSVPGVFVAGDVRAESVKRVASAVGEGAMAVTLVHRYLEAT